MPPPPLPVKAYAGPVLQDGEEVIVHSGDLKNLRATVAKAVYGGLVVVFVSFSSLNISLRISNRAGPAQGH